jgi:PmbA protein
MGYASTEALSEQGAAALVRRAADNAASLEAADAEFLGRGGQSYAFAQEKAAALPTTEQLIATVHAAQKAVYAADEAVVDGTVSEVVAERLRIALCNSNGLDLNYENTLTGVVQTAVVEQGGEKADGFGLKLGALDNIDLDALAAKTAAKARAKLHADVAPTGVYPVVFAPEAMCSLLAAYSGIFSAENAQKGLSRLAGREGGRIAADCVTLVDDPAYPGSPLPMPFDAEGTPTRRKNVIENGVLTTLLYSLKTAAAAGRATTGNAAKRSYAAKISVSPFTLYLAPGTLTEDELLAKAGNGVYINALGGLHAGANGITGDFSLQSAGFLIENGRKGRAVRSFTVAGNFYDLLRQITAVADTVELPTATGITCFGSPSVLVEGLSVAGK